MCWCSQEIVDKCHESLGGTMLADKNLVEQLHTVAATLGVPLTMAVPKKSTESGGDDGEVDEPKKPSKKVGDGDGRRQNKKGGAPTRVQRSLDEKIK